MIECPSFLVVPLNSSSKSSSYVILTVTAVKVQYYNPYVIKFKPKFNATWSVAWIIKGPRYPWGQKAGDREEGKTSKSGYKPTGGI